MPKLAQIETVVFLQSVDLFAFCRAEEVLRIAAIAREKTFEAGEQVFRRNELPTVLYCVVRGEIELTGPLDQKRSVGPLQTFGVQEILSGRLRPSDARALSDSLLLALEAEDLFDLLANNIEIVKSLFRSLCGESRDHLPSTHPQSS